MSSKLEPFKVEIKCATPALITRPPMLDSIIAWCAVQDAGGDYKAGDNLPLLKKTAHGSEYWAASRFFYLFKRSANMILTKRVPMDALTRHTSVKKRINGASTPTRAFNMQLEPQWIHKAIAFGVGDIDAVEQLLINRLTHFGRNVRNGMGRVVDIDVQPFDEDWSEYIEGVQVSDLPAEHGKHDCMARLVPPYWKKSELSPVVIASDTIPKPVYDMLKTK